MKLRVLLLYALGRLGKKFSYQLFADCKLFPDEEVVDALRLSPPSFFILPLFLSFFLLGEIVGSPKQKEKDLASSAAAEATTSERDFEVRQLNCESYE